MRNREGLVWLKEERVFGHIVGPIGAYYTMIAFKHLGILKEILVENDDFEMIEEGEDIDDRED